MLYQIYPIWPYKSTMLYWCLADSLVCFQEEVIQAVEKVCTYLPKSLSTECKDLIETYGQAIIELLVQQADPKTVCTVLALCNEARRTYVGKFMHLTTHTHTHTHTHTQVSRFSLICFCIAKGVFPNVNIDFWSVSSAT